MFMNMRYQILKPDGSIYKIDSFNQHEAMPISETSLKKILESNPWIANAPQLQGGFEVKFIEEDSQ